MTTQERIRQALDDLASAPEPANLADRALRAADRRRARNIGAGVTAGALVLALAGVGATHLSGQGGGAHAGSEPCVQYTSGSNGRPDVPRDQWPDFVSTAVAALPARSDYSMQSGYGWCGLNPGMTQSANDGLYIAYAVINLGLHREAGELTVNVAIEVPNLPADCATALSESNDGPAASGAPAMELLSCDEATASRPLTYALGSDGYVRAAAAYDDGTLIEIECYGNAITPRQLAAAAADPRMYAIIPFDVPPAPVS